MIGKFIFNKSDKLTYERQYGYSTCLFNTTQLLYPGDNHLKVIAINSDQPNSRWYNGAIIIWRKELCLI